jgi:hypothetical protein
MNVYEVRTETSDTPNGRTHDRFTLSASNFKEAVRKSTTSDFLFSEDERVAEIVLLARGEF